MRGRFAPSPTGDLHLGNARTALLAWLQVRSAGGRFIMRVEDLDPGRARAEFIQTQLADLRWLGLDWNEGPDRGGEFGSYLQSERHSLYEEALDELERAGLLYECYCTRKEIAAAVEAPHVGDEGPVYPGTCRGSSDSRQAPAALRFRVPLGRVYFDDIIQGRCSYSPADEIGDFVVRRKDGVAAYQLAVVADDAAMQITDVLRGADLLASTARQILLYDALGLNPPRWAHVPLMLDQEGERMSKRAGARSLRQLREADVPAERVIGWLAATCGMNPNNRERSPAELIAIYDPLRIPRHDTPVKIPDWLRG